ncbi:hypothetical protein E1265_32065 [Streptomyces sp. 8K308]|uniref:hypothetical protein n=1 Tax=Streptomyces sp. 8K308 TaxID=2530388 RepID=UPI0010491DF7|nr:hypothetical protein [Streptomyces sp. 8K308]TDC09648.1 hypothetical protein E1265_32065 [Streptomyces sp. 8K308]
METWEGTGAVTTGITLRWGRHELMGQLVTDPTTGRVGRLDGVLEHVARGAGRVLRVEAHMRPVDGSGVEWTADANALVPMTESS